MAAIEAVLLWAVLVWGVLGQSHPSRTLMQVSCLTCFLYVTAHCHMGFASDTK